MKDKSKIDWKHGDTAVIREKWEFAGTEVQVLGSAVFCKQWWVPVKLDTEPDPTFYKEAALLRLEELPDRYIPTSLRPVIEKEKRPREKYYCIGQLKETEGEIEVWSGPNPSIATILDVPGCDINSVIVKFDSDGTYNIIYRWYPKGDCWGKSSLYGYRCKLLYEPKN